MTQHSPAGIVHLLDPADVGRVDALNVAEYAAYVGVHAVFKVVADVIVDLDGRLLLHHVHIWCGNNHLRSSGGDGVVPLDDPDDLVVVLLERRGGVRLQEVRRQLTLVMCDCLAADPGVGKL